MMPGTIRTAINIVISFGLLVEEQHSPRLGSNVSITMSPMVLLPMWWCSTAALSRSVFPFRVCLATPRAFSCNSSSDMAATEDRDTESDYGQDGPLSISRQINK